MTRTLIEYYDKDVLKNIMGSLTLHPDKVIFLYDSGMAGYDGFSRPSYLL